MKLRDQYRRLHQFMQSTGQQPGLPALAQALHCSERNMRLLLAKMQAQGWLSWHAGLGRGNLSRLQLLVTPESLALDHLSGLLAKGDLEHAFASLDRKQRAQLAARLPDYLGVPDPARRSFRMPAFRYVESLDPLKAFGRMESHLVRQIFSRLTTFDSQQNILRPAIAHHWEHEKNGMVWHFWLRPGLSFHDGSELTTEDVRASFLRLRQYSSNYRALYQHLRRIELGSSQRVSFYLDRPDYLWPHCLAMVNSSIVPRQRQSNFEHMPIGSGAFRVSRHNHYQITLSTFKDYYKERPLLDEIDLWMIAPPDNSIELDLKFGFGSVNAEQNREGIKQWQIAESGCSFIICNPNKLRFKSNEQRLAFGDFLSPFQLFDKADPSRRPASGLLAQWSHRIPEVRSDCPIKSGTRLRMYNGQSPEILQLGEIVAQRLRQAGVKVDWTTLNFKDLIAREWMHDADFMIGREILHDDIDFGCFKWFSADTVFRRWLAPEKAKQLDEQLRVIPTQESGETRMKSYAEIGKWLVGSAWLLPLSHENQQVSAAPHVAGVRATPFGFVAFNELWLRGD
nr:ABC transporter substrate-binding protein [uncultured Undibacterium sp.]